MRRVLFIVQYSQIFLVWALLDPNMPIVAYSKAENPTMPMFTTYSTCKAELQNIP